jgi:hypothetical protein
MTDQGRSLGQKLRGVPRVGDRKTSDRPSVFCRGVAGLCTRRNALENHGKAKQREDDVEWFDACFDVRHLVVTIEIFLQARYAERTPIEAANAAIPLWKRVPGKAAIGGIGERVSQCRQFPIENRDYARLLRMKIRFPIRKSPWQIAV